MSFWEVLDKFGQNSLAISKETAKILLKIVDDILKEPKNPKIRTLQKSNNNISRQILQVHGGILCLKCMGFIEDDICFRLSPESELSLLQEAKETLSLWLESVQFSEQNQNSASLNSGDRVTDKPCAANCSENEKQTPPALAIKPLALPPFNPIFQNPFLCRIENYFHQALHYANEDLQVRAKRLVPLEHLEKQAQKKLQIIQEKVKFMKLSDPNISAQDLLILEVLQWFKEKFFTWVDSPACDYCNGKTHYSHMSSDKKQLIYTNRVEIHRCESCCTFTPFARYNDLNILLETRKGRCGEWANTFTLICRALGWDSRLVVDETDHVWTEVYSFAQGRWLHCDPCENICDKPLIYETGWKKDISYIIAYSSDEVQDVTWRYTSNHKEVLKRRKNCTEMELIDALIKLRTIRQDTFSASRREYLTKRLLNELVELMVERKAGVGENEGRQSGDWIWRISRGETQNDSGKYVWVISENSLHENKFIFKYSSSRDVYEITDFGGKMKQLKGWNSGTFSHLNIRRKEEKDWKQIYLSRKAGDTVGCITWKFNIKAENKSLDVVTVNFPFTTFENGEVTAKLMSGDISQDISKDSKLLVTKNFSGKTEISIIVSLTGGRGDASWQHAQLFRQEMDGDDYPFTISFTFK